MSATTAVTAGRSGRLGMMVRTPTELFVYWRPAQEAPPSLVLRITDLTGRPEAQSLDGRGWRQMELAQSVYIAGVLPGHLYLAEVGSAGPDGFRPLLAVGPVQTPWLVSPDSSGFPAPYHRS